jgi:hypothetical protein
LPHNADHQRHDDVDADNQRHDNNDVDRDNNTFVV